MENCRFSTFKPPCLDLKRCEIGSKLLMTTNRNMYRPTRFQLVPKSMILNDLCAGFKVIDSLNAAKMAKYSLVMTPTPCRVTGCIISVRRTYSCTRALTYLLAYLLTYTLAPAYKAGNISETVEDRAKANINDLYKIVHWLSIAAKMYDVE